MSLFERLLLGTSYQWMLFLEGDGFLVDYCILQRQPSFLSYWNFSFINSFFCWSFSWYTAGSRVAGDFITLSDSESSPAPSWSTCDKVGDCAEAKITFHWGSLSLVLMITTVLFYFRYNNGISESSVFNDTQASSTTKERNGSTYSCNSPTNLKDWQCRTKLKWRKYQEIGDIEKSVG